MLPVILQGTENKFAGKIRDTESRADIVAKPQCFSRVAFQLLVRLSREIGGEQARNAAVELVCVAGVSCRLQLPLEVGHWRLLRKKISRTVLLLPDALESPDAW
jgi:hypothetical protein